MTPGSFRPWFRDVIQAPSLLFPDGHPALLQVTMCWNSSPSQSQEDISGDTPGGPSLCVSHRRRVRSPPPTWHRVCVGFGRGAPKLGGQGLPPARCTRRALCPRAGRQKWVSLWPAAVRADRPAQTPAAGLLETSRAD